MIEVLNLTSDQKVKTNFLKNIAKKVLELEKKEDFSLSIFLVGPARIRNLNKKYRGKNRVTDVLSFGQVQDFQFIMPPDTKEYLGEVIICLREVKKHAKKSNISLKEELARVLIHGILHLLGYEHENSQQEAQKMEEKQNLYLKICHPFP